MPETETRTPEEMMTYEPNSGDSKFRGQQQIPGTVY